MVFRPNKNEHGILFKKFVAAEQEFNTNTYGIKGNIDANILIDDKDGNEKLTALEIKTGKHKRSSYRGQVVLYSLLIAERFKNSNPDNILLYIMDDDLHDGFDMIMQHKLEIDAMIRCRNELAKWYKLNQINYENLKTPQLLKDRKSSDIENIRNNQT